MNRPLISLIALALVAAACSSDGGQSAANPAVTTTSAAVTTTVASTTPPTSTTTVASTTPPTTTAAASPTTTTRDTPSVHNPQWIKHEPGDDCQCADGSSYHYWTRTASTTKVLLYLEGGGACFTAETCSFTDGTYSVRADTKSEPAQAGGIFQLRNPRNPFADWSIIYMPYCTGDVHIGNSVHEYAPGLTVHHNGFRNAEHGLKYLTDHFPDAKEIVVAGSSAGSIAAPLFAGLVADSFPNTMISVLSDGSGSYPDIADTNVALNDLWGSMSVVPDWEVNVGMTSEKWSIPGLFVQAGLHAPGIRFARFDHARDRVQASFTTAAGIGSNQRLGRLDQNEANIEAAGVNLHTYVAPGSLHTVLRIKKMYTLTVEGVPFIDWLNAYVAGEDVPDVHCKDCGP